MDCVGRWEIRSCWSPCEGRKKKNPSCNCCNATRLKGFARQGSRRSGDALIIRWSRLSRSDARVAERRFEQERKTSGSLMTRRKRATHANAASIDPASAETHIPPTQESLTWSRPRQELAQHQRNFILAVVPPLAHDRPLPPPHTH